MKSLRRWCAVLVLAIASSVFAAGPAAANGAPTWSLEQLAGFADVVVIARVDELTTAWDPDTRAIYTFVSVAVDRVLKGSSVPDLIVIKQLGGRVGPVGLHISDQADFHVGETTLLFLEVRPRDGTLYTTALWQGKWSVDEGEAQSVTRQPPGALDTNAIDRQTMSLVERSIARGTATARREAGIEFVPIGQEFAPFDAPFASAHGFTLLGPLRYLFSPIVDVQSGGQPGLPGGGLREIQSAINKWNNAGAQFRYALGTADARGRCTTEELGNDRITISFMDPCNEMSNTGGTLAIGGSYYFFGGAGSVDGTEFNRASEGFIVTNDGPVALDFLTKSGCFEDVQTHELGHVLGLGHSIDPNAIMFPTINAGCGGGPRSLGQDDLVGIGYIYGFRTSNRATAPVTAPSQVQVSVNGTRSVTVSWGAVEALSVGERLAATSYRVDFRRGHQEGAPLFASYTTAATTLTIAIPAGLSGDFNVVVTPVNADGGGPASFQRNFTICGGPVEAVAGLSAVVTDGVVRVAWQPSPGATSYRGQAGSIQGADNLYPITELGNTTVVEAPVDAGFAAWLRIVAVNGCGTSAPADVFVSARD
jgi:hypothetical protein